MMKHLAVIGCLIALTTGAYAQNANSSSTSVSGSNSANDSSNRTRVEVDAGSTSGSISGSNAASVGNTGGNSTNVFTAPADTTSTVNHHFSGDQKIKNVPSVNGPPLVTSNDTCMGSTSASVNAAGFGLGIGTTWTDDNCKLLKNSRELWNMGMKAASMALMCMDPLNRAALQMTGYTCPSATPPPVVNPTGGGSSCVNCAKTTDAGGYQGTDPIVRARLGLPALK